MEREKELKIVTLEDVISTEPLVKKADEAAQKAHENQFRDDGITPYIEHARAVARIAVEELKITNPVFVAACFLHDTVEDTSVTLQEIKAEFGPEVAELVDGVTKIAAQITDEPGAKKVIDKSFYIPQVGILKAACDRTHNMRTMDKARPDKVEKKAKETLVYARLLESLGVWQKMIELEDTAFYYLERDSYTEFKNRVENDPRISKFERDHMISRIESVLEREGVVADVNFKLNGLLRLKNKMEEKSPDFKDLNDVITYTVRVATEAECFQVLRLLRTEFGTEENVARFDDFLSFPRDNGYSAIQMTIETPHGATEIAITTKAKDEFNNLGVVSLLRKGVKDISEYSLVLIFTPDGSIRFFKPGATGIDFAYNIDPALGAKAANLVVDGVPHEMSYILKNGQTVEVIPGEDRIAPNTSDWLKPGMCRPPVRRIIEGQFLEEKRLKLVETGRNKIGEIVKSRGLIELSDLTQIEKHKRLLENFLTRIGCKGDIEKFYYQIGAGRAIAPIIKQLDNFGITQENLGLSSVFISGNDHPGIAKIVTGEIAGFGVNIEHQQHKIVTRNGKKVYEWRIVTEKLSNEAKESLAKTLSAFKLLSINELTIV